jgi:hypothetical protein
MGCQGVRSDVQKGESCFFYEMNVKGKGEDDFGAIGIGVCWQGGALWPYGKDEAMWGPKYCQVVTVPRANNPYSTHASADVVFSIFLAG